jgi:hypothetical protein
MAGMQTDIEVLKNEVHSLSGTVASIGAKMDLVLQMQLQIVQLNERQEHQRQALDRAFGAIKETRVTADKAQTDISKILSFVRGGAIGGAALFSFAQWYVYVRLDQIDAMQTSLFTLDRRMSHIESKVWPDTGNNK